VNIVERHVQTSLAFLHDLFGHYQPRNFAVRLWDGTVWDAGQPASFTLVLKHPGALRKMFLPPNGLTLGEAYLYEDFDIEDELEAILGLADSLIDRQ